MLTTHHFLFTAEVVSPLELDDHSGAALRGSLFEGLWKRFCTNKASPTCAACPLHNVCPVSSLVAPLREENPRGRDIPRPYLILPPLGEARRYEPGKTLIFGLTLFGSIIQLLPYVIMARNSLEALGLGRKLPENKGRRGQFRIKSIESYHHFTGERRSIYQQGKTLVQTSLLQVTEADVEIRATSLPTEQITLNFLTPTRIIDQDQLIRRLAFRSLVLRLLERFTSLVATYGEKSTQEQQASEPDLIKLAKDITCQKDETLWKDVQSYSHRQHRLTPVSGITGQITFTGELAPFRELLAWGELIHVGRSAVKGNGWYKIVV